MASGFLQPCDLSRKLCKAFGKLQMDDIPVTKGVKVLRKIHDDLTDEQEQKIFLKYFTHILKLPLSRGTSKDRMSPFEEKVFEVACQFATSFLHAENETEGLLNSLKFLKRQLKRAIFQGNHRPV